MKLRNFIFAFVLGTAMAAGIWASMNFQRTAPASGTATVLPVTIDIPAFSLLDHEGRSVDQRVFEGQWDLVFFGFTNCPDICPLDLQILVDAVDALGDQGGKVQPLFVTVDPGRDTVARLADYVPRFHPRLIGLTGVEAQIRPVIKAYRVARMKVPQQPDGPGGPDAYLVGHGSLTYLMGPDGNFLTFFRHDGGAEFMTKTIRKYLSSEKYRGN